MSGVLAVAFQCWEHALAMGASLVKQHLRPRPMMIQSLRACTPCALLALLSWAMRTFKTSTMKKKAKLFPGMQENAIDVVFTFAGLATIMIGFSFFVGRLTAERQSGLRHLMHVSGLSRTAFWSSIVCIEGFLIGMGEATLITVIGGLVLRVRVVVYSSLALLAVGWALLVASSVLQGCVLHMVVSSPRASNIIAMTTSLALTIAPLMFGLTHGPVPEQRLNWWMFLCPVVPSYQTLLVLANACAGPKGEDDCLQLQTLNDGPIFSPMEMLFGSDRASEATAGGAFVSLVGQALFQHAIMWPLVILADVYYYRPLARLSSSSTLSDRSRGDETRRLERAMNEGRDSHEDAARMATLLVQDLVHWYGWMQISEPADAKVLNGVSFRIAPGAMLGLLGPNGAGKTTTIRCITGEEVPRSGTVQLRNVSEAEAATFNRTELRDIERMVTPRNSRANYEDEPPSPSPRYHNDPESLEAGQQLLRRKHPANGKVGAYLGLCPQDSALNEDLSVEEHLILFARLRGCPSPQSVADSFVRAIQLESKRHSVPGELSGGMRRRLAVGCSMVGHPALALLDEPTTGLDPIARREIWSSIMGARDAGTACLLTTHMLEEAEELCTHIVILSKGRVAAEGSVQELKDAWSTGYLLHVDVKPGEEEEAQRYVASLLPELYKTPVRTSLHGQMIFNVSRDAEFVGNLFILLARGASRHGIRHWGISQASLEDAYLRIIQQSAA